MPVTDWDGVEYRRVSSLQQWLADRALRDLDLSGVRSLIDIGCGDGRITAEIAARVPGATVVGLDASPRMIAAAATTPGSEAVRYEVGDVLTMAYVDDFDCAVSFNALHWVVDQAAALSRIAAALHRPGRALLVLVGGGERPSLERVAMEVTGTIAWRAAFSGFSPPFVHPTADELGATARSAGLTVVDQTVEDLSWDFGTTEAFTAWCAVGFGAWTDRLPEAARDDFVRDVVDAYRAATGSSSVFRFMQLRSTLRS